MNSDANSMTILTHFSITNKKFIFRNIISILIWLNRTLMPIIRKLSAFTRCAKFIIKFTRLRWETENIVMGDKICWWQERVRAHNLGDPKFGSETQGSTSSLSYSGLHRTSSPSWNSKFSISYFSMDIPHYPNRKVRVVRRSRKGEYEKDKWSYSRTPTCNSC